MNKIQNFHLALIDYLNKTKGLPFVWGERDCVTFAIGAIEAMIGREVKKPPLTYETRREARAFNTQFSLALGMKDQLDAYEVIPAFHQPGDIAIVLKDGLEHCHVIGGKQAYAPQPMDVVRAFDMRILSSMPDLLIMRFD